MMRNKDLVTADDIVVASCANARDELKRMRDWAQKLSGVLEDEADVSELTKLSDILKRSSGDLGEILVGGAASA